MIPHGDLVVAAATPPPRAGLRLPPPAFGNVRNDAETGAGRVDLNVGQRAAATGARFHGHLPHFTPPRHRSAL